MKATIGLGMAALLALPGAAWADQPPDVPGAGKGNQGCTLNLGGDFKNPGEMLQYLRDRPVGASGNPKDIVDAYPTSFTSVGDLIDQKCGENVTPP